MRILYNVVDKTFDHHAQVFLRLSLAVFSKEHVGAKPVDESPLHGNGAPGPAPIEGIVDSWWALSIILVDEVDEGILQRV